jgi:CBS domain-containing protein
MVPEPRTLDASASSAEAGQLLARPEVHAVFVSDADGRLVGVLTRKTLVREVVATGRDPAGTPVGEIAEEPYYTIDSDMDLEAAFHFLEEHDAERVPVVEDGRLVGMLSRELLQRRLAEDEPPPPLEAA